MSDHQHSEPPPASPPVLHTRLRRVRRVLVAIVGTTILVLGILMIVLPGPSFIVIPLGLGILATEFLWARHVLARIRRMFSARPDQTRRAP